MHPALPIWRIVESCCHSLAVVRAGSSATDPQYRISPIASSHGLPPHSRTKGIRDVPGTRAAGQRLHLAWAASALQQLIHLCLRVAASDQRFQIIHK